MAHAFDNRNFTHDKQQNHSSSLRTNLFSSSYEQTLDHRNKKSPRGKNEYCRFEIEVDDLDEYFPVTSDEYFNETKPPPPPARMISTSNNNYIRRSNLLSQYSTNGMKTNTTYLNTTQLYISQPSSSRNDSPPPPPPPPRYPLSPPAIPPRNPRISPQKNSIIIPDFNSSSSAKVIYRSPVPSSPIESNHSPLIIDTNSITRDTTIGEYFGKISFQ